MSFPNILLSLIPNIEELTQHIKEHLRKHPPISITTQREREGEREREREREMEEWSYLWAPMFLGILGWLLILHYVQQNMKRRKSPEPPGRLPFLGHLHHFLLSRQHLHRWLHDFSTRYGPILSLQMGSVPVLLVSSPNITLLVLQTHDLSFASRPNSSASVAARFTYNSSSLANTPYGPYWCKVM